MNELETVAGRQTDGRGQHRSAIGADLDDSGSAAEAGIGGVDLGSAILARHPRRNADRPDVPFSQVLLDRGAAAGRGRSRISGRCRWRGDDLLLRNRGYRQRRESYHHGTDSCPHDSQPLFAGIFIVESIGLILVFQGVAHKPRCAIGHQSARF